jgi:hypothetical protein
MRQIDNYTKELTKILSEKADVNKKIAEKRKKLAELTVKVQREEGTEKKTNDKIQQNILLDYEHKITELKIQLQKNIDTSITTKNVYQNNNTKYDVFISHASEDKKDFANELNQALVSYGFKVWYDTQAIAWGDSLRAKIDEGLRNSRYGIVIISKHYINKGWTQYELDGLFQKEMTFGKTILPIWHNITKQEVQNFSPSLAGLMSLNTSLYTTIEIANQLRSLFVMANTENQEKEITEGTYNA